MSRSLAPDADSLWTEETRETDSSSVQKSNSAKIESFNKENRNLLEKAEEQQVFTKHFVLPTDEKGIRQEQTITYQGEQLQKLVMTNTTPASDELKKPFKRSASKKPND